MSDDLAMEALSGTLPERAVAALAAGCDVVLLGSGKLAENELVAGGLSAIDEAAHARLDRAMARIADKASTQSRETLTAKRDALLAHA
jgi:beta-N-acetylhexosaminidase